MEPQKIKSDTVSPSISHEVMGPDATILVRGWRRAERSYSMFKVRRGGGEEIPLVQDKEQPLHFVYQFISIKLLGGGRIVKLLCIPEKI